MPDKDPPLTIVQQLIVQECDAIKAMLLEKNRNYGNSALEPAHVFSRLSPEEGIKVRLDDKINRLKKGKAGGEDVELDLVGYIVLLRVCRALAGTEEAADPIEIGGV